MKKIERRALLCLVLIGALACGLAVFTFRFFLSGAQWAAFSANQHLYQNSQFIKGRVLDRNGEILAQEEEGKRKYHPDADVRKATLHTIGDKEGRIGASIQNRYFDKLTGYSVVTGTYAVGKGGSDLILTLDADVCKAAYQALEGRKGAIGVYNYQTGDIICMVSSPTYDPENPPEIRDGDTKYAGVYVNRFLSSAAIPGSIFKLVTAAAALDTESGVLDRSFLCKGTYRVGGVDITCPKAHGTISFGKALTVSCNCTFGKLAEELGADTMETYTKKAGLMDSVSVSGIDTARGSFDFATDKANLAWSGIGQGKDLVNPCAFMMYMGGIANGGTAVTPRLVSGIQNAEGIEKEADAAKVPMLSKDTADALAGLMRDNVKNNYGDGKYPGLSLCAKSGTAEVGGSLTPHAWFAGFLKDEKNPYAFVVWIENGGSGSQVAGPVANKVLQAVVKAEK